MIENDFGTRIKELKRIVNEKYLSCIFIHAPHFTIHGNQHSSTMEQNLNLFLEANNIKLNKYEDYLLRCAIWLHDIGMIKREGDEKLEDVRNSHHRKSQAIINCDEGRSMFHLNHHESFIVGVLSYLHRKSVDIRLINEWIKDNCVYTLDFKNNDLCEKFTIRVDLLAMLLRILDACDRSHIRSFDPEALKQANIPEAGKYHWAHYLISSVDFKKNKIIINSIVPPLEDNKSSTEENIITDLVINDMKKEIDSLDWVLRRYDFSFKIEHNPVRQGTSFIPGDIYDEYINYRNALKKGDEFGEYTLRSLEKTVCIYKNGHSIIDLICDLVVTDEKGLSRIYHVFAADDSPPDFQFSNFDLIREVPITERFQQQAIFFNVINSYGKTKPNVNLIEESDFIGDPFRYKEFYLNFSSKLNKNTKLKYGIGYSSPKFINLTNPDKYLYSAHFLRFRTNTFVKNIKIERGLKITNLNFSIHNINNEPIVEEILDVDRDKIQSVTIYDGSEGVCLYSRENTLYYDVHRFEMSDLSENRKVGLKFKVVDMEMERTA